MPDNSNIIEELVNIINKGYDKQLGKIDSLTRRLEEAQAKGMSQGVIDLISGELDKLNQSIDIQKTNADNFYKEMVQIAGGRTDLDKEMLRDAYSFRHDYVRLTKELENLIAQRESEENKVDEHGNSTTNSDEIAFIERKIDETLDKRANLVTDLQTKYGANSYAAKSAYQFMADAREREKIEENIEKIEEGQVSNLREIIRAQEINNKQLQEAAKYWNVFKNAAVGTWNHIKRGGDYWLKYNEQAISDARRLGMASKEEAMGYMETLMENSKQLSRNFGISYDQAMKMQDTYSQVTGRASMLTQSQMEDIAASSKLMGESTVNSAMEIMNNMGTTSQATTELLDKNYARAVNTGLDIKKAGEAFVKNMSLANKLNFRNGVDGISKMTILSQRIKLNLQEVANVAEKFSTIEGALENSARLQMLGGAGAMLGSNPMAMMYEALADPEALYKRMADMFKDQAIFNRKTGEAEIDPVQMAIIKEQAKAMGMNPEEAIQSAKQQSKLGAIEADFRRARPDLFRVATEEQKAAITNKAEYNKDTGQWEIKYVDENNEEKVANLNQLTADQLKEITKDNIEPVQDIRGKVREIAKSLVSTNESLTGLRDTWFTGISQMIHTPMKWMDSFVHGLSHGGVGSQIWNTVTNGKVLGTGLALGAIFGGKTLLGAAKIKTGKLFQKYVIGGLAKYLAGAGNVGSGGSAVLNVVEASNAAQPLANSAVSTPAANVVGAGAKLGRFAKFGRIAGGIGAGVGVALDVATAFHKYNRAEENLKESEKRIDASSNLVNTITRQKRFDDREIEQRKIAARNEASATRGEAVGGGTGAVIGAVLGGAIASSVGLTAVGVTLGGMAGKWIGEKVGREFAKEEAGDIIAGHLKDINKSDSDENFRRIVLPVESIDYNVSLIANQLGIISAMPARGNIYLESEAAGETIVRTNEVEAMPMVASKVNERYENPSYSYSGPSKSSVSLDVSGTIDLNLTGQNVGKISAEEFKKMFDANPELQRQIVEVITNRQVRNGNAARNNSENSDNRLFTTYSTRTV